MRKDRRAERKKKGRKQLIPDSRFTEKRLTSRAGTIMVDRFMRKLGLERIIDEGVDIERGKNSLYGLGMIFTGIVLGIVSGGRHISNLCVLSLDEALMRVQGWESFPVVSSITRVLERFRFCHCVQFAEAQRV